MSDFSLKLKKILRKYGCCFYRKGKGDHEIWCNPKNNVHFAVDSKIKSRHTANEILKQAGLSKKF